LGYANASAGSPSNPYNFSQDYGRAPYDIRNRIQVEGTVTLPWKLRLNPNISYQSAPPFNITQGIDEYGDSLTNTRPAFEPAGFTGPSCSSAPGLSTSGVACVVSTANYGNFVINPTPGMKIIPINYGHAYSQFTVNMRVSRTWGFGERLNGNNRNQPQGQGGQNGQPGFGAPAGRGGGNFNGGGNRGGGGGGGGRGGGGGDSSGQRFTLTAGIVARNIFNTVNPAAPVGDLLDNRFDVPYQLANIGGANVSANRRMELNLRFSF
jgi:hypothetical protein